MVAGKKAQKNEREWSDRGGRYGSGFKAEVVGVLVFITYTGVFLFCFDWVIFSHREFI